MYFVKDVSISYNIRNSGLYFDKCLRKNSVDSIQSLRFHEMEFIRSFSNFGNVSN